MCGHHLGPHPSADSRAHHAESERRAHAQPDAGPNSADAGSNRHARGRDARSNDGKAYGQWEWDDARSNDGKAVVGQWEWEWCCEYARARGHDARARGLHDMYADQLWRMHNNADHYGALCSQR